MVATVMVIPAIVISAALVPIIVIIRIIATVVVATFVIAAPIAAIMLTIVMTTTTTVQHVLLSVTLSIRVIVRRNISVVASSSNIINLRARGGGGSGVSGWGDFRCCEGWDVDGLCCCLYTRACQLVFYWGIWRVGGLISTSDGVIVLGGECRRRNS
jgi:hypothetical protein